MKRLALSLVLVMLGVPDVQADDLQTWKDVSGKLTIEARLTRIEGNNAILARKSGKELRFPLEALDRNSLLRVCAFLSEQLSAANFDEAIKIAHGHLDMKAVPAAKSALQRAATLMLSDPKMGHKAALQLARKRLEAMELELEALELESILNADGAEAKGPKPIDSEPARNSSDFDEAIKTVHRYLDEKDIPAAKIAFEKAVKLMDPDPKKGHKAVLQGVYRKFGTLAPEQMPLFNPRRVEPPMPKINNGDQPEARREPAQPRVIEQGGVPQPPKKQSRVVPLLKVLEKVDDVEIKGTEVQKNQQMNELLDELRAMAKDTRYVLWWRVKDVYERQSSFLATGKRLWRRNQRITDDEWHRNRRGSHVYGFSYGQGVPLSSLTADPRKLNVGDILKIEGRLQISPLSSQTGLIIIWLEQFNQVFGASNMFLSLQDIKVSTE